MKFLRIMADALKVELAFDIVGYDPAPEYPLEKAKLPEAKVKTSIDTGDDEFNWLLWGGIGGGAVVVIFIIVFFIVISGKKEDADYVAGEDDDEEDEDD